MKTFVAGCGMTEFVKPRGMTGYEQLGLEACVKAFVDAGLTYDNVDQAYAGYCYGDSTSGQRVLYQLGMTGIPVVNVNNNCSTGSTALYLGNQAIKTGAADCVLCVGFEVMERGSLQSKWTDRENPLGKFVEMCGDTRGVAQAPFACQLFANAGQEYVDKHGGSYDSMAEIARINHKHSAANPYSQFKTQYTVDEIKSSPVVYCAESCDGKYSATKLQACPTSDGAACVILVSERFLKRHPELSSNAVEICGQSLKTDTADTFDRSAVSLVGFEMTRAAGQAALRQAQIAASEVQVVELHDCFAANELISLDALGLCARPGQAAALVPHDITFGGKYVVNPSGGLISKGHPLGATGLAQCCELTWHLRGWCTNRRVEQCRYALQHNVGLGGAVVVTVYKRPDGSIAPVNLSRTIIDGRTRLGYNPAVEAHGITMDMFNSVKSQRQSSPWMLRGSKL